MRFIIVVVLLLVVKYVAAQDILPTPMLIEKKDTGFTLKQELVICFDEGSMKTANYISGKLSGYLNVEMKNDAIGDIVLSTKNAPDGLGVEGYSLETSISGINITAQTETGLFYGIQSLLQLLPPEVQAGKPCNLVGFVLPGVKITDKPKYTWRSFMLDSGRQYQTPECIKKYLDIMALLKMNIFHWHLTEGLGWRIEIKKYPKLTGIGSQVAKGKEQQGFYSQEVIREIVAYAQARHITVVPEIDVPGHSEAALTAYPEMSCFNKVPETVMGFSANLFCGGREQSYKFLQDVLDEVCDLFPSEYIHLGGDEAPKKNWDACPDCKRRIANEGLKNSHDLQLFFSSRLANYLKTKNRKAIFWGDVVREKGYRLPDNVVIHWWNFIGYKNLELESAVKQNFPVICGTNRYTYLNFPVTPWAGYKGDRTFDIKDTYENNPSKDHGENPLVLGISCALWTDYHVTESMIDQRLFPRIFSLAEQMWHMGAYQTFDDFYSVVKSRKGWFESVGYKYGPGLVSEVPIGYKWN